MDKQRRCFCELGALCPAIEAVAEYLRNGGQRACPRRLDIQPQLLRYYSDRLLDRLPQVFIQPAGIGPLYPQQFRQPHPAAASSGSPPNAYFHTSSEIGSLPFPITPRSGIAKKPVAH